MKKIIDRAGAGHLLTQIGDTVQWASTDPSGESGLDASMTWDEEGVLSMLASEWAQDGEKNGRSRNDVFRVVVDPDGRVEEYKGEQDGATALAAAREFGAIIANMKCMGVDR